jgi:hypothetical protein
MPAKSTRSRKVPAKSKQKSPGKKRSRASLRLTIPPVAKTGMLIRKPVTEVFEAIVDPAITTRFWFTKSDGRLEEGKPVKWEWEMYGTSTRVVPQIIQPNKRNRHAMGRLQRSDASRVEIYTVERRNDVCQRD